MNSPKGRQKSERLVLCRPPGLWIRGACCPGADAPGYYLPPLHGYGNAQPQKLASRADYPSSRNRRATTRSESASRVRR